MEEVVMEAVGRVAEAKEVEAKEAVAKGVVGWAAAEMAVEARVAAARVVVVTVAVAKVGAVMVAEAEVVGVLVALAREVVGRIQSIGGWRAVLAAWKAVKVSKVGVMEEQAEAVPEVERAVSISHDGYAGR